MLNGPTLFDVIEKCYQCGDSGLWLSPSGTITECPRISVGTPHNSPNDAARILGRSVGHLQRNGIRVDAHLFALAVSLTRYCSAEPCHRDRLIERHFGYTVSSLRHFHTAIERLRSLWLLPVGSRKESPAGYWIITDINDFKAWVVRSKTAPITQLSTIHRVAKRNFPVFAEQMEIEFWNDIEVLDAGGIDTAA